MTSPAPDATSKTVGPAIHLRDLSLQLWYPKRTLHFSRVLEAGRVHAFVGESPAVRSILQFATGRQVPDSGSVRVDGEAPSARSVSCYAPDLRPPAWWRRLLRIRDRPPVEVLERALAKAAMVFVSEPFARIEGADRDRIVAAVRGASARGATVLVHVLEWRDALPLADVFHLFGPEGDPEGWGDLDSVFRPDVRQSLAPDAIRNERYRASVLDLAGVRVPLTPRGSLMSVHSSSGGFQAWTWKTWFHVPARRVVLDPPFAHGTPSGSPPLRIPTAPAAQPGVVDSEWPDPGPIDTVARWVVLEGKVLERASLGGRLRLKVTTGSGLFHVDLAPGAAEPSGDVRLGFDSAHVVS